MEKNKLKREITLPHLVLYGMGSMIGAGIYVLIGIIASHAQYYTPFVFLISGVVGLLTAMSYSELSHHFPYSAGAAIYIHHGFGKDLLSKFVGYLVILSGIISCGALAKGFAGYAQELVNINYDILVFSFIFILGLIACWRINFSMWMISIIAIIEIFGLIFVITVLFPHFDFSKISTNTFKVPSSLEIFGILNASLLAFYAFIGFEDMVNIVEETKVNTMRMGVIYAFLATCFFYFLIAIVTIGSVDMSTLTKVKAPFAIILKDYVPWGSKFISIVSIIATINGALIQIILSSRIFYGMARKKMSHPIFAKINPITHTPIIAVIFTVFLVIIFAYVFPIEQLARLTSSVVLFVFSLVNLALIRIIRKNIIPKKRFIHLLTPSIAFIFCVLLLIIQIYIEINKYI